MIKFLLARVDSFFEALTVVSKICTSGIYTRGAERRVLWGHNFNSPGV
jgi:hypothetical protein